jgi:DNA repair protein RadC
MPSNRKPSQPASVTKPVSIKDWPAAERPREKLLSRGSAALSDAELLALCLRSGCPGRTAVDLARELLSSFGGLRAILNADQKTLCACRGIGSASYAELQAVLELARRYLHEALPRGPGLASPRATHCYLKSRLRDLEYELFCCLFLDNRHRVIRFEPLFRGTIDGASVHPREVVKMALSLNAAAVIFAHNHPSGVAEPSDADERITRRLQSALDLVDIRVLDHLIVGDSECVSFAERGLL